MSKILRIHALADKETVPTVQDMAKVDFSRYMNKRTDPKCLSEAFKHIYDTTNGWPSDRKQCKCIGPERVFHGSVVWFEANSLLRTILHCEHHRVHFER